MTMLKRGFIQRLGAMCAIGLCVNACSDPPRSGPTSVHREIAAGAIETSVAAAFPLKVNAGFPVELASPRVILDSAANQMRLEALVFPEVNILRPAMHPPENPRDPKHVGRLLASLDLRLSEHPAGLVLGVREVTSITLEGVPEHVIQVMREGSAKMLNGVLGSTALGESVAERGNWRLDRIEVRKDDVRVTIVDGAAGETKA